MAADICIEMDEIGNKHPPRDSFAAKLYLQPIFSWPNPGRKAGAHGVEAQVSEDVPVLLSNEFIVEHFCPNLIARGGF